jgi:predicted MFS family arabinose efflux permease
MKKWNIVILLCIAQFVMVLDSTVMNVSMSEVAADLDTNITHYGCLYDDWRQVRRYMG